MSAKTLFAYLLVVICCRAGQHTPITPSGWRMMDYYPVRTPHVVDTTSGLVPLLVAPYDGLRLFVSFVDYAKRSSSLVQLTNLSLNGSAPCSAALRGTNLWLVYNAAPCFGVTNFYNTNAFKILHYGISGNPPSAATLLDDTYSIPIVGCCSISQNQVSLYYTPVGGIFHQIYMPNPFTIEARGDRMMGLIYRTPSGIWTHQYPVATVTVSEDRNVEEMRTAFAAHPADGAIWGFSVEPGSYTIRTTRLVESSGVYTYSINKQWIKSGYGLENAWESPPPCTLVDPWNKKLVLMYGGWVMDGYLSKTYNPAQILDVAADGTYLYQRNTNIYVGPLMTGMAGMILDGNTRQFVYRDMKGPRNTGYYATSEGLYGTNVPLSIVTIANGVWSAPEIFVDQADIMIGYIQNAPGIFYTHWPDRTVMMYCPTNGVVQPPSPPPPLAIPPTITQNPVNSIVITAGETFTLSSMASGTLPLAYQWFKDGNVIVGATSPTFSRSNAQFIDGGSYWVIVTNTAGSARSTIASVNVQSAPPPSPLPVLNTAVIVTPSVIYNRQNCQITSTITSNGTPVAGASVQVVFRGPKNIMNATVVTGANGKAVWTFQVNANKLGRGQATVSCTASKAGYMSDSGTAMCTIR